MRLPTLSLIFLFICSMAIAGPEESPKNSFGLKASNISGYGFYYNREIFNNFHIQPMAVMYIYQWQSKDEKHREYNYDLGLEFQLDIDKADDYRIYLLTGAYYYYEDDLKDFSNLTKEIRHSYNTGLGVGIEYRYSHFTFTFDLGYKYYDDRIRESVNHGDYVPVHEKITKLGAGIGIGFSF